MATAVQRQMEASPVTSSAAEARSARSGENHQPQAKLDIAELIEAIEDRVLAQLERRGGLNQGAF